MIKESDSQLLVRIDERVKTLFENYASKIDVRKSLDDVMDKHVKNLHNGLTKKQIGKLVAALLPLIGLLTLALSKLLEGF